MNSLFLSNIFYSFSIFIFCIFLRLLRFLRLGTNHPVNSWDKYSAALDNNLGSVCLPITTRLQLVQRSPRISPVLWSWSTESFLLNVDSCRSHTKHRWFCFSRSWLYSSSVIPYVYFKLYLRWLKRTDRRHQGLCSWSKSQHLLQQQILVFQLSNPLAILSILERLVPLLF